MSTVTWLCPFSPTLAIKPAHQEIKHSPGNPLSFPLSPLLLEQGLTPGCWVFSSCAFPWRVKNHELFSPWLLPLYKYHRVTTRQTHGCTWWPVVPHLAKLFAALKGWSCCWPAAHCTSVENLINLLLWLSPAPFTHLLSHSWSENRKIEESTLLFIQFYLIGNFSLMIYPD